MRRGLVLGGASCIYDDARRALAMFQPDVVVAVNDMISLWPEHLDHVGSLHVDKLPGWIRARKLKGYNTNFETWSFKVGAKGFHVDHVIGDWRGSSGLFGVQILMTLGVEKIVVAGVPMEKNANHIVRRVQWGHAQTYVKGWNQHAKEMHGRVKSMSGWTRGLLGEPTPEWLELTKATEPGDLVALA